MAKFTSKKDQWQPQQGPSMGSSNQSPGTTFMGKSIKIKGKIVSNEEIVMEGRVEGNIKVTDKITIGKNGIVDGDIQARTVRILGKAKGSINASTKLEICSHGNFQGDIESGKLVIEEGAIFNGNSTMSPEPARAVRSTQKTEGSSPASSTRTDLGKKSG